MNIFRERSRWTGKWSMLGAPHRGAGAHTRAERLCTQNARNGFQLASFGCIEVTCRTVLLPKGLEGPGVVTEGAREKGSMIDIESP